MSQTNGEYDTWIDISTRRVLVWVSMWFFNAASCWEFRHQKKLMQIISVSSLKKCIAYEAEISSVAEACIRKCVPEPLIARVYG